MKELKSIYTWSDENRARLAVWAENADGAPRVLSDAVKKFIDDGPAPALYSLFETVKKAVHGSDASDVLDLEEALEVIENTDFDDWDAICEFSENYGYDTLTVAYHLYSCYWTLIDDINDYSDLGKWYVDNYISDSIDTNFLAFYVDYDWLGHDLEKRGDFVMLKNTGRAVMIC